MKIYAREEGLCAEMLIEAKWVRSLHT